MSRQYTDAQRQRFNALAGHPEHQFKTLEEFTAYMQEWEDEVNSDGFGMDLFIQTLIQLSDEYAAVMDKKLSK